MSKISGRRKKVRLKSQVKYKKGQVITLKPGYRRIYLGRTRATVVMDDPEFRQVWTKEIPSAVDYKHIAVKKRRKRTSK